jgi:hypothetical protein
MKSRARPRSAGDEAARGDIADGVSFVTLA